MSELQKLLKQKDDLDKQIAATRSAEKESAIVDVKAKIALFGLTAAELGLSGAGRPAGKPTRKVAPQFRDPVSGATWSGRGKPPKWIAGKERSDFAI